MAQSDLSISTGRPGFASPVLACLCIALMVLCGGCLMLRTDTEPLPRVNIGMAAIDESLRRAESPRAGPAGDAARGSAAIQSPEGWPHSRWWRAYGVSQLDELVERALLFSPLMAVAAKRAEAAGAKVDLARANLFPFVELSGGIDRQRVSDAGFLGPYAAHLPRLGLTGPWYTAATAGLTGAWDLDIFGKNRSLLRAEIGAQKAGLAEKAEAELLVSCAVVDIFWEMQTLVAMRALLAEARDVESLNLAGERARNARGLVPRTDAELARTRLASLEAQIAAIDGAIVLLREGLKAMLGFQAEAPVISPVSLPAGRASIPDRLGYELLARRPDLQAAHWYIEASLGAVDAARAAFYPSFNILAFLGYDTIHIEDLFMTGSKQINLIGALALPLFDFGRLNANLKLARAESDLSIASYNAAVVKAVHDVAVAAAELQSLDRRLARQDEAVAGLEYAAKSAEAYRQRGLADKTSAAKARLPLLVERGKALELRGKRLAAETALIRSLGGGYRAEAARAGSAASGANQ